MTWDRILEEIEKIHPGGLEEKTLYGHYRHPHRKPNHHVSEIIDRLHSRLFPNPFPAETEALMRIYNHLISNDKNKHQRQDILDMELFVHRQCELEPGENLLRLARFQWLAGNIAFDRIAYLRDIGQGNIMREEKQRAIQYYEKAAGTIDTYNSTAEAPVDPFVQYKLTQNILACYLNAVREEHRNNDPGIHQYLMESNYLDASLAMLEKEQFQWLIARNGLRFSSLIQDRLRCEQFFRALVKSYKGFADLDYRPLRQPAIGDSDNFRWAVEEVLTDKFIDQVREEL